MDIQAIKEKIDLYKILEQKFRSKLLLILVANVEGKNAEIDDYPYTSVLSEYYTLEEYELLSLTYKKLGYEVLSYFSEQDFMSAVIENKIHTSYKKLLVINSAQTGKYIGRKSLIPAFCDHFKIMYTGSNPYVVSLCRDKFRSSVVLNQYLPNPMDVYLYSADSGWMGGVRPHIGQKVIAKLNGESASIGLSQDNIYTYSPAVDSFLNLLSQKYTQTIVIQPFISGYETELPILVGKNTLPLIPIGIQMKGDKLLGDNFLDYSARFHHTYDFYNFNNFNSELSEMLQVNAVEVGKLLGIEGFGRVDFRITPSGEYYISDVATNPHITMDSSYAFTFRELGYTYQDMLSTFLGISLSRYFPRDL